MTDEKDSPQEGDDGPKISEGGEQPSLPEIGDAEERLNEERTAGDVGPDDRDDQNQDASGDERVLSDSERRALRNLQRRVASMMSSPTLEAIREQQRRVSEMLSPATRRAMQQRRRIANVINLPAIKALEEQHRRLSRLIGPNSARVTQQQRALAELTNSHAFESLRHSQMQIAKVANAPAVQAIAQQQAAWKASAGVQQVITSAKFYNSYLAQIRAVSEAVSKTQIDPAWRTVIRDLQASPEVRRWAGAVSDALDDAPGAEAKVQEATEALAGSAAVQEALQQGANADTAPLEELIDVSARAFEEASRVPGDEPGIEPSASEANAETYRALLKLWGVGNVVAVVTLACLVSGQPLVLLGGLAAIAQISGYSVKDLIDFLRGSDRDK